MPRYGSGSAPIATGWKCTNCHRTHQSSIRRSDSGSTRARPELTTATSRLPRNWSAPCPVSSGKCKTILTLSDRICVLFADRNVPLIMRGCLVVGRRKTSHTELPRELAVRRSLILVAHTQIEGEIGKNPPVVLEIEALVRVYGKQARPLLIVTVAGNI